MRLVMYPVLLVQFWRVLEGFPWWDRGLVVLCQFLLCVFNYGMLPFIPVSITCLRGTTTQQACAAPTAALFFTDIAPGGFCSTSNAQAWLLFQQLLENEGKGACMAWADWQVTGSDCAVS